MLKNENIVTTINIIAFEPLIIYATIEESEYKKMHVSNKVFIPSLSWSFNDMVVPVNFTKANLYA